METWIDLMPHCAGVLTKDAVIHQPAWPAVPCFLDNRRPYVNKLRVCGSLVRTAAFPRKHETHVRGESIFLRCGLDALEKRSWWIGKKSPAGDGEICCQRGVLSWPKSSLTTF